MPSSRLAVAIDGLPAHELAGTAYRHVARGRNPLSGAGARSFGGRWNPPENFATLYLACEIETTEAEFLRMAMRMGRAPGDFLPRVLYRSEFALHDVLDLTAAASRGAVGLVDAELHGDDWERTQAIGDGAHYLGREGILAPSATGRGTVLAIFSDRLRARSYVREVDSEEWVVPGPDALRRSLAVYRMAFGQPRREDLVSYLMERYPPEEIERLTESLVLDLGPAR